MTFVILSLTFPGFHLTNDRVYALNRREWVRGLAALVLLFDVYTVCERAQGYLFSKPLDRDTILKLLATNRSVLALRSKAASSTFS